MTHAAAIFFTFAGSDEGDEVCGAAADVAYNAADESITGTMRYHQGDDIPFVWRRERPAPLKSSVRLSPRGKKK